MKTLGSIILVLILLAMMGGWYAYDTLYTPIIHSSDDTAFHVPSQSSMSQLKSQLATKLEVDTSKFSLVAKAMKFNKPKAGRYQISEGMSAYDLVSILRSGRQSPIKLTVNNVRTIQELAGLLSRKLESDSLSFIQHFISDGTFDKYKVQEETVLTLFVPDTYEMYWNTSPAKVLQRFATERNKYFDSQRKKKMQQLDMTMEEVYTLASIVQKETLVNDEKPKVAGVYINRLRRDQLLQADPTVVFANGDFGIKRVLNKHLLKDSPYNTYMHKGLPPGPIYMPDKSSLEAVLNYEKHKYLYFCASPDNSGRHLFAKTLIEHNTNANRYRAYLNKNRIYK